MIEWWWIPITIVVTGFFVLLALGMGKSAGDFDAQHEAWMAGVEYARLNPEFMAGGKA